MSTNQTKNNNPDKKNTEAWLLKQEQKKNNQQNNQQSNQPNNKKKQQPDKNKNDKNDKNTEKINQEVKLEQPPKPKKEFKELVKLSCIIEKFYPQLLRNRNEQQQLIIQGMTNHTVTSDIVLFIGNIQWKTQCQQIGIPKFNNIANADLICRYQDISYFMQNKLTKIFCWVDTIFANNSVLLQKGSANIILSCKIRGIKIIGCSGSWSYCNQKPESDLEIESKFGVQILDRFDWVDSTVFDLMLTQMGENIPSQTNLSFANKYKSYPKCEVTI